MIDKPGVELEARPASSDVVNGSPDDVPRAEQFLRKIRDSIDHHRHSCCELTVVQTIPTHRGLGSGTQLGLAVARIESEIADEVPPTLETLARRVGRGMRSAVGLHGFQQGGFLVDGGRADSSRLGTLVVRAEFPAIWRFVLACPRFDSGLSGEAEQAAFSNQRAMPAELTAELCRTVLMDWLPAVIDAEFERCSSAMFQFGHAVGEFFSPVQQGVFANRRMREWAELIRRRGVEGVAQTSWGPTLAVLCSCEQAALQLKRDFTSDSAWADCEFTVAAPLNQGAKLTMRAAD